MAYYTEVELPVEVDGEKRELLALLRDQRNLFLVALRNLTDEQARQRTTVSELTLGGFAKHLAWGEQKSAEEIVDPDPEAELDMSALGDAYTLLPDETLDSYLQQFVEGAAAFDRAVAASDLDTKIPMPTAPWAPEREWLSVRELVAHKLRETAHHCGHADIIREALDSQTTMAAISEGQEWADEWT
ncbi:hypothetical protein GOARA_078_00310 [Gordonia araii NBRC 100433]|uniref:DinB-like domain-containing protein n=1 Tax=Gordonia araii NBRC 100433 TaxID=1073574 RepID=G7H6V7_9ACTN|nr:DUF664 domain-containing protein [Gordonia araii]NNG95999.1 DUF664 domain-containing protein [Gordonia araii NBRC 100433]GAB11582.1 hypothetical protein GOARA_078_00310 [Gordonia araii NBRC 100433]